MVAAARTKVHRSRDTKFLTNHGANAHEGVASLGVCQGDCDNDAQCTGDLICHQGDKGGEVVIGCRGKTHGATDYCVRKKTDDSRWLINHGNDAHKSAMNHGKLGLCQGDCDSDKHCRTGLICHHSEEGGQTVEGCQLRTAGATDYCVTPPRSHPINCADWTCTEWCNNFSVKAEAADVYILNGCDADGDTCECE